MSRSLSSAASTVFWCVSGTESTQPRCWCFGGSAFSAASAARASRNVSRSVSMMSDAGIDSGIYGSPSRKRGLSYPQIPAQKGTFMRITVVWSLVFILLAASVATAAAPELKTEEQKTLYALGVALSQNLTLFNLTDSELDIVKAGLADGAQRKQTKVDMQTYGP